ncbi:MAG: hypothetical protein V4642_13685 [Bacteroidota bacterium]
MYRILLIAFLFIFSVPLLKAQVYLMCDTEFEYPAMAKRARITGMASTLHFNIENGSPKIIKAEPAQALLKEASIKNLSKLRFLKDSNHCRITFFYELKKNITRGYTEYLGDTIKIVERDLFLSLTFVDGPQFNPSFIDDTVFFGEHLLVDFPIPNEPEIQLRIDSDSTFTLLKNNYSKTLKEEKLFKEARYSIEGINNILTQIRKENKGREPSVRIIRFYLSSEVPDCNYNKYYYEFK